MAKVVIHSLWLFSTVLFAGEFDAGDNYFDGKMARVSAARKDAAEAQCIDDLTDYVVWSRDLARRMYFDRILNKLKADGSEKSTQALELFINTLAREDERGWDETYALATIAWLELKARVGGEQARLQASLTTFERDAPVNADIHVCYEVILRAGKQCRDKVYSILLNRTDNETDGRNRSARLGALLLAKDFIPTNDEIDKLLTSSGLLGKMSIFVYLSQTADPRAIPTVLDFFHTDNRDAVLCGIYALEDYKNSADREKLIKAACDFFDAITVEKWGNKAEDFRWRVMSALYKHMRPSDIATKTAKRFMENYSANFEHLDDARRQERKIALDWAKKIIEAK